MESVDQNLLNASYTLGRGGNSTPPPTWYCRCPCAAILAGATLAFARGMGEFGATIMVSATTPGHATTMPIAIYSQTMGGDWGSVWWMIVLFVLVAGVVMYVSNRLGRKAVKA